MITGKRKNDEKEEMEIIIKEGRLSVLPVDLLVHAIQILDQWSIRAFSLANKGFRKLVEERGLLEYKLNKKYSIKYYESGFIPEIANNLNNVRRKIEFRNGKVISLNLRENRYLNINRNALGPHIQEVNLSFCHRLNDVSTLEGIKKLNLLGCSEVRDISSLGKVEDLDILFCHNISDISCLSRVNSLRIILSYINRGLEVLENVNYLRLHGDYNLTAEFLNKLKASHIVVVHNYFFSDVSLLVSRPRSKVSIYCCPLVVDVSPLSKIKSVELWYMDGITDVSALSKCDEVYLHDLNNITDYRTIAKLNLSHYTINVDDDDENEKGLGYYYEGFGRRR